MKKLISLLGLFLMTMTGSVFASPDAIVFNSGVSWRADGKGDFILKDSGIIRDIKVNNLGELECDINGFFEINNSVGAESNISSFSVNWESKGNVIIELSADGGVTYVKAANSVPITSGFNVGKSIRWRAIFGQNSKLSSVKIVYTCQNTKIYNFGNSDVGGFKFRKKIKVFNSNGIDLQNFQIKVKLATGKFSKTDSEKADVFCDDFVTSDFRDIRFIAADGITNLKYFIEEITEESNLKIANVWVKVPFISPEGVDVYLYYGNSEAESFSSAVDTFDYYDDFSDNTLENSGWVISKDKGGFCIVNNGVLKIGKAKIYDKNFKIDSQVVDLQVIDENGKSNLRSNQEAVDEGFVGINASEKLDCDWIRARKKAVQDPTIDANLKEQKAEILEMPIFSNSYVNEAGRLMLIPNQMSGQYISQVVVLDIFPRILISNFDGANNVNELINLNFSLDNGENYTNSIEKLKYYYLSKKDFTSGNKLIWKANLNSDTNGKVAELKKVIFDLRLGKITLISPNGKEVFAGEENQKITWSATDYDPNYTFNLEYSVDNGKTFTLIKADVLNKGTFEWSIPKIKADKALVKISDSLDKTVFDTSDSSFKIEKSKKVGEYIIEGKGNWHTAANWESKQVPDLMTEAIIEKNAIIYVDKEIAFRSLIIGDGVGDNTTVVILRNKINPESGNLIIRKGGVLIQESKIALKIAGDLVVEDSGLLSHSENKNVKGYILDFSANNITVKKGGQVFVDGKGFAGGGSKEAGKGVSVGVYDNIQGAGTGGSHAGLGGDSKNNDLESVSYGDAKDPVDFGSGGAGGKETRGGAGGGIIKLNAVNNFKIYGKISANGADGGIDISGQSDAGGGAGGSIYLTAGNFGGVGAEVLAIGGSGHKSGGGGGGGRIYIKGQGAVKGILNVNGGDGFDKGKAGSIVFG